MGRFRGFILRSAVGLLLGACGESSSDSQREAGGAGTGGGSGADAGAAAFGERFEGMYTLDTITQNDGSCTAGGESLRDVIDDSHLVAKRCSLASSPCLALASCSGLDACRDLANTLVGNPTAGDSLNYVFVANDGETVTGTAVYPGTSDGGVCRDGGIEQQTLMLDGAMLTVELRGHLSDYPVENGTCSLGAARQHGSASECTRLRVITGTLAEPL